MNTAFEFWFLSFGVVFGQACDLAGLKVNEQLVAHATRFLIVRLKNHM